MNNYPSFYVTVRTEFFSLKPKGKRGFFLENIKKNINNKIIDYKRFAFVLVSLSVFLYLGAVLPVEEKTLFKTYTLMGGTLSCLASRECFSSRLPD